MAGAGGEVGGRGVGFGDRGVGDAERDEDQGGWEEEGEEG